MSRGAVALGGNYSGVIVQGVIIWGSCPEDNYPEDSYPVTLIKLEFHVVFSLLITSIAYFIFQKYVMNESFHWKANNVSFSRYLDFCVFVESTNFKTCDVIIYIDRY